MDPIQAKLNVEARQAQRIVPPRGATPAPSLPANLVRHLSQAWIRAPAPLQINS